MKCCINCFRDSFIRKTIESQGTQGNCDFCASRDIFVIDITDASNPLSDKICGLVQAYAVSDLPNAKLLKESLRDDWDIFSGGSEAIDNLVKALCTFEIDKGNEIFCKKVVIPNLNDEDFIRENAVAGGLTWGDFSNSLKHENRFHSSKFNADVFVTSLSSVVKIHRSGELFYRARIAKDASGYECDKMGAPPLEKRTAGRVNPEGIGILYLSLEKETVLNEIRANVFDYVTIGTFRTKRDLRVVNLSDLVKISPFDHIDTLERFALNRDLFHELSKEIAKPLRRSDSTLEYLPTQYISEFVKSQGYDGVEYDSTLRNSGHNLALFDLDAAECVCVKTIEISGIDYSFN